MPKYYSKTYSKKRTTMRRNIKPRYRKTTYARKRYYKKSTGIRKFQKSMKRPLVGIQYKSIQMKAQIPLAIQHT